MQSDDILEKIGISRDSIITPQNKVNNEKQSKKWRE